MISSNSRLSKRGYHSQARQYALLAVSLVEPFPVRNATRAKMLSLLSSIWQKTEKTLTPAETRGVLRNAFAVRKLIRDLSARPIMQKRLYFYLNQLIEILEESLQLKLFH